MNSSIEIFLNNIKSITETDYGDFMRLANLFLNNLKKEIYPIYDENINAKLFEMQSYLQYYPNWDINSTKDRIFKDCLYLNEILLAHKQDWESAPLL